MSVEAKAANIATITSIAVVGAAIASEFLRKRDEKLNREYMEQTAGDSRILFQREGKKFRSRLR